MSEDLNFTIRTRGRTHRITAGWKVHRLAPKSAIPSSIAWSGSLVTRHQGKWARFRAEECYTSCPLHYTAAFAFSPSFTRTAISFPHGRPSFS